MILYQIGYNAWYTLYYSNLQDFEARCTTSSLGYLNSMMTHFVKLINRLESTKLRFPLTVCIISTLLLYYFILELFHG